MTSPLGQVALEHLHMGRLVSYYTRAPYLTTLGAVLSCHACGMIYWIEPKLAQRRDLCWHCGVPHPKALKLRCYWKEWVDVLKAVAENDAKREEERKRSLGRKEKARAYWRKLRGLWVPEHEPA